MKMLTKDRGIFLLCTLVIFLLIPGSLYAENSDFSKTFFFRDTRPGHEVEGCITFDLTTPGTSCKREIDLGESVCYRGAITDWHFITEWATFPYPEHPVYGSWSDSVANGDIWVWNDLQRCTWYNATGCRRYSPDIEDAIWFTAENNEEVFEIWDLIIWGSTTNMVTSSEMPLAVPPISEIFRISFSYSKDFSFDVISYTSNDIELVVDQEAPVISSVTANPNKLWPPNHKMVPVTVTVDSMDNCDSTCQIISVASNEPVNGLGDGDTAPDLVITGDLAVELRAERSGKGNERIYTITVECADSSGNSATDTATVTVLHDKGKK